MIDQQYFFEHYKALTISQKFGIRYILNAYEALPHIDRLDWLAYCLATTNKEYGKETKLTEIIFFKLNVLKF